MVAAKCRSVGWGCTYHFPLLRLWASHVLFDEGSLLTVVANILANSSAAAARAVLVGVLVVILPDRGSGAAIGNDDKDGFGALKAS